VTPEGSSGGGVSACLHEDVAELEPLRSGWETLATATGSPFGGPIWTEAWWRHLAPAGARLAVVAVHRGGELIGLAPFYASDKLGVTELRLLGGGWSSRLGVLAEAGAEEQVATAVVEALRGAPRSPDIVHWEAIDAASPWPELFSTEWPGGRAHRIEEESQRGAPVVHLSHDSYEDWFAAKSSHFRSHMRRDRRKIDREDVVFRFADRASLERDLNAFGRLHSTRREGRGGSTAVSPGAMAALLEIGATGIDDGRFRLQMIDGPDGEAISAQLYVAAGNTVAFWNTGFDEAWRKFSPGALAVLVAIEDAFERGDTLMDLGGGEAAYKERLADEDRPIAWRTSFPRGPRYPLARLRRAPGYAVRRGSQVLRARLGQERFNRARSTLGRLGGGR
jgi:CelD/BcsL family acetyltransferase involved in cellulose biosynthesis